MARTNLIICSASEKSLHHVWLDGDPMRNWDLCLLPFRPLAPNQPPDIKIVRREAKPKFLALHELLTQDEWWRGYTNIAIVDEDVFAMPKTWSNFFDWSDIFNACLSAPALTANSIHSHPITIQQSGCRARRVSFVESMMPCFSTETLAQLLPTFADSPDGMGWGLDYLWAKLLDYKDIYIIDDTPVTHWRPSVHVKNYGSAIDEMLAKHGATRFEQTFKVFR